jgi:hypothetical protein
MPPEQPWLPDCGGQHFEESPTCRLTQIVISTLYDDAFFWLPASSFSRNKSSAMHLARKVLCSHWCIEREVRCEPIHQSRMTQEFFHDSKKFNARTNIAQ